MAVTREITITYGGYSVGGSTGRHVHDFHYVTRDWDSAEVRFKTVLGDFGSASAFASACEAFEAAFSKPRQDLTISFGGSNTLNFSHGGNTGFDAFPEVRKPGSEFDSARSRMYEVTIQFGLPANTISTNGRRDSSVRVTTAPSGRRTVTISGVYTAIPGTNARAQYTAQITAYCAAVLTALGITASELTGEPRIETNDTDKVCTFERTYTELIFSQAGAALDDADLVDQQLQISATTTAPGDGEEGGGVNRLKEVTVNYSAWVDKSRTTDLAGKWEAIKPWLTEQVSAYALGSIVIRVESTPQFSPDDNRLTATARYQVVTGATRIEYARDVEYDLQTGARLAPVWSGDRFEKYRYVGPGSLIQTIKETVRDLLPQEISPFDELASPPPMPLAGGQAEEISHKTTRRLVLVGEPDAAIEVTEWSRTIIREIFKPLQTPVITLAGLPAE